MIIDYVDNKWVCNTKLLAKQALGFPIVASSVWISRYLLQNSVAEATQAYDKYCKSPSDTIACSARHYSKQFSSSCLDLINRCGGPIGVTALLFAASVVMALSARRVRYIGESAVAEANRNHLSKLIQRGAISVSEEQLRNMTDRQVALVLSDYMNR